MKSSSPLQMLSHHELVQLATDLLSTAAAPELWLASYDAALASSDDVALVQFCRSLKTRAAAPRVVEVRAFRASH